MQHKPVRRQLAKHNIKPFLLRLLFVAMKSINLYSRRLLSLDKDQLAYGLAHLVLINALLFSSRMCGQKVNCYN